MLRENVERRRTEREQELVAGMRRDDPEAYMEFFRSFRPLLMAEAMRQGVEAGRKAFLAGRIPKKLYATASSPLDGLLN